MTEILENVKVFDKEAAANDNRAMTIPEQGSRNRETREK